MFSGFLGLSDVPSVVGLDCKSFWIINFFFLLYIQAHALLYPRQRPRHQAPAKNGPCSSHMATARPGPALGEAAWTQAPHAVHSLAAGPGAPGAVPPGSRGRPRSGPCRSEAGCGGRPEGLPEARARRGYGGCSSPSAGQGTQAAPLLVGRLWGSY